MKTFDAAMLKRIAPTGKPGILSGFARFLNDRASLFSTELERAHFIAQNAHESAGFKTVTEYWGPTAAQKRYEGRKDLGNTKRGDGKRYMGRGTIQLTGRANYRDFTQWAQRRWPDAPDFEADPAALQGDPWCYLAGAWYWDTRKVGDQVRGDKQDVVRVTQKINGGSNGLADRKAYLARTLAELQLEGDETADADEGMLQKGDTGPAVRALQQTLKELDYWDVGDVDGEFGAKTEGMVLALQKDRGLFVDGKVGPKTWASLKNDKTKRPISKERREATVEDLREKGSVVIKENDKAKTAGKIATIATTGYGVYEGATSQPDKGSIATQLSDTADKALDQAGRARGWIDGFADISTWAVAKFGSVIAWLWAHPMILIGAGLGIAVWYFNHRAQQARVKMYQRGEG
ncbi:MAG: peptidoglycan-binding protein [Bradyrhizobium sp.]